MALKANDILLMTCKGALHGQVIINTSHYTILNDAPSGPTGAQVLHLANIIGAGLGGNNFKRDLLAAAAEQYSLIEVWAQKIWPTREHTEKYDVGDSGTNPDVCNTTNVACSISRRSDSATRDGQGRWQFAGVPDNALAQGNISTVWRSGKLDAFAQQLKTNVTGTTFPITYVPVLYTPRVEPFHYRLITSVVMQDTIRTMHRRTVQVGI
jgi:hypothetical protein